MGSGSFLALVARMISSRNGANYRAGSAGAAVHNLLHLHDAHHHQKQQLVAVCDSQDYIGEYCHELTHVQPAPLLFSFHVDLAERLQHLQLQGSGSAHLNWLLDALASTLFTHSSLRSAASSADLSVKLAPQRADEVVGLLDVCSALKQVADDVQRQLRTFQQALESVGQALAVAQLPGRDHRNTPLAGAGRVRAAARRLSVCLNDVRPESLLCVTSKQYRPLREARASLLLAAKTVQFTNASSDDPAVTLLSQAMDGTMLTSLLMLASAISSVASPSPRKSSAAAAPMAGPCKAITKYLARAKRGAQLAPWAAPLRQIQGDLRKEEMGGALFEELTRLHSAAANIHAAITNPDIQLIDLAVVRHRVDCLRKSSQEAQACITTLHMHMGSLFQALIALRLALLES